MNALLVIVALLGLAAFAHVRAQAELDDAAATGETSEAPILPSWGALDLWGMAEDQIEAQGVENTVAASGDNVAAFATMVASGEGTEREPDPYRVCYAYRHVIESFADHPAVTGEWRGEPLDNLGPAYAGKVSTAAGRYQIIRPTWLRAKRALGLGDFSPASQDLAFAWLVKARGALDDVVAGNLATAIAKCAPEWASLPGSTAGQGTRSLDYLASVYANAGGTLA